MREPSRLAGLVVGLGLAAGCASSSPQQPASTQPAAPQPAPPPPAAPKPATPAAAPASSPSASQPPAQPAATASAITLREEKDLGKVWLAPGFDFTGYDGIVILETRAEVPRLNPDGVQNLEWAKGQLRNELIGAIQAQKLFPVVASDADVKAGSRVFRLENTIIEYEKGGGGARFFAGLYGAGQPVIKVRGRLMDGERALFVYEARRSGDSGVSRMFGGYRGDKAIQEEDIRDLVKDLLDFVVRTAKKP